MFDFYQITDDVRGRVQVRNKKLSCRRETARRFMSLNILLSHSKWHCCVGRVWVPISISMMLGLYVVPFLRYSGSKNGVTLKLEVGIVRGHWKWRRSIDHIGLRLSIGRRWSAIVNNHDLEKVTEDHSNWYHSKAWVRFSIRLPL